MIMDKVRLEGMVFYGYHGVLPEERKLGQRFVVDLEVECDLSQAGKSDRLADTVNYTSLFNVAKGVMEGEPHNLLESLAEDICKGVLASSPLAVSANAKVHKPAPPIKGALLSGASVEINRRRT
jgi:dihydroneopterin aldolase